MIELYVFPRSSRAFKVMAVATYLGIEPTLHALDLIKGDQKSPEYAALNPNMRMPTLKDGDYVLWESNAIMQYLASKRPESGLLPSDEKGRLDVTRWQFWDLAHWDPTCAVFLFENVVKSVVLKSGEPDAAAIAKATESFHRVARVLDGWLKGKKFVVGSRLTVADFSLGAPAKPRRDGSYPGRAVPRNQTLVWDLARIAGLAEDTGAMRPAGRRRGLRLRRGYGRADPKKLSVGIRPKERAVDQLVMTPPVPPCASWQAPARLPQPWRVGALTIRALRDLCFRITRFKLPAAQRL